jgi:aspartokinase-like uncharacterized kinase
MMNKAPIVVKVGGSLFDLPDLGWRLESWLKPMPPSDVILTVGGGPAADVIRALDRIHGIGEKVSHNLAVETLGLMTSVLLALAPPSLLLLRLGNPEWFDELGEDQQSYKVLDLHSFTCWDEQRPGSLPQSWDVTSDSLAARFAEVFQARELILLKSVTIPPDMDWSEASRRGFVDAYFPKMIARGVKARAVNLREWQP